MVSHAELLTMAYDALGEGDAEPFLALFERGAIVHATADGPFSGSRTVEQLRDTFERMQRASDRSHRIRAHAILTEGEHAIVLEEHSSSLGESRAVAVYHMVDGTIRERWLYLEDQNL